MAIHNEQSRTHGDGTPAADMDQIDHTNDATTDPTTCVFLNKIPAEIRNNIYELAVTPEVKPSDKDAEFTDLVGSKAPEKSLLLTCKKIHQEAHGLYRASYRRYWTDTKFVLTTDSIFDHPNHPTNPHLRHLSSACYNPLRRWISRTVGKDNLSHVTQIRVYNNRGWRHDMVDKCGIWAVRSSVDWFRGISKPHMVGGMPPRTVHLNYTQAKAACGDGEKVPLVARIACLLIW